MTATNTRRNLIQAHLNFDHCGQSTGQTCRVHTPDNQKERHESRMAEYSATLTGEVLLVNESHARNILPLMAFAGMLMQIPKTRKVTIQDLAIMHTSRGGDTMEKSETLVERLAALDTEGKLKLGDAGSPERKNKVSDLAAGMKMVGAACARKHQQLSDEISGTAGAEAAAVSTDDDGQTYVDAMLDQFKKGHSADNLEINPGDILPYKAIKLVRKAQTQSKIAAPEGDATTLGSYKNPKSAGSLEGCTN